MNSATKSQITAVESILWLEYMILTQNYFSLIAGKHTLEFDIEMSDSSLKH